MAATVTSPWATKPGKWALDSEEHEADLLQQKKEEEINTKTGHANGGDAMDFPSLAAAISTKTKKKKPQTMSFSEFLKPAAQTTQARGLTTEDRMALPTGPREWTAEELDRSRLGGGFRSYGSYDKTRYSNGDESSNSRWGSSRVSDEARKREGFGNRELAPSRADEVDDWGSMKKPVSSERRDRGFFGSSESKADESDSWVSNKSFVPSDGRRFDNSRERRVGFASSGGSDSDNWLRKKEEEGGRRFGAAAGGGGGGAFDSLRERRGGGFEAPDGGADSDNWGKKREEGSGSGRPRLNLQPRSVPVGEGQQNDSVTVAKPKGSNPFGEARPREEVLKEKGQDWKEIDEKLESMKFKEIEVPPAGKRGFGSSSGRGSTPDGRTERSWRKPDSADVSSPSADKIENGLAEDAEDLQE